MGTARTQSVVVLGTEVSLVTVEAGVTPGPPAAVITGLPASALRETRDRVRAAVVNSGERWPDAQVTVGLYPGSLPKHGSASDLAIAVAIMTANGDLPRRKDSITFYAELGIDGRLRPVPGALPAALALAESELDIVVVAAGNYAEASLAPKAAVVAARTLAEVTAWLRGGSAMCPEPPAPDGDSSPDPRPAPDLANFPGQPRARTALEASAAGGHHLSLLGPPESGKTMLAQCLPGILPPLDAAAALEVTSLHSAAGCLPPDAKLITAPPFCAPHRTASTAAMLGGGSGLSRPGAVSLAHRGILFLDDAPDFPRDVLDALRQPLEAGQVTIARAGTQVTFPARFTLVLAANPCPCARAAGLQAAGCACTTAARRRYLARLSGPLLDRIDVKTRLYPLSRDALWSALRTAEPSAVVAQRVAAARDRAAARLAGTPWRLNAEVPGTVLRRTFAPQATALAPLDRATELGQLSARGTDKAVRVAWTLADLSGKGRPGPDEVSQAIALWLGTTQ
jgi:magnesium chelatase family protein